MKTYDDINDALTTLKNALDSHQAPKCYINHSDVIRVTRYNPRAETVLHADLMGDCFVVAVFACKSANVITSKSFLINPTKIDRLRGAMRRAGGAK